MDKKTIFIRTEKGEREGANLSSDLKRILSLIDNKSKSEDLAKRAPPSLRESWDDILNDLVAGGYIRDKNMANVESKIAKPRFNPLRMFTPKPAEDLDFHTKPVPDKNELAIKQQAEAAERVRVELEAAEFAAKQEAAARARAELEASVAAAKVRADAEAKAKAEAKARQEAEMAARARAEAELKAKQEAMIREQAEAKAKQEAAARMQAQASQEAAARAKADAEARVRAEIEAAARAQQVAETKAKQEAEAARLKAEQEAAHVKAELEAAARANAEAEARIRAEIEAAAKAKAEAEAVRRKAEEEAARVKAELEAAKARAEAEAKALAEARARQIAEEKVRREAEAVRLKAEQEAARVRVQQEAAAKAQAEAAAIREAEENAKRAAVLAEMEALTRAAKESAAPVSAPPPAFEIKLDGFMADAAQPVTHTVHADLDDVQARAEAEAKARLEAQQRAAAEEAKAEAEKNALKNVAAEMARLKEEAEAARRSAEESARRLAEEKALAEEQAKAWAEAEQRAKTQAIHEAERAVQQAALSQAKGAKAPVARKHRKPLPVGKIAFGLVTLALVLALVLPYVYPLNDYIAPLEQRLSAQLKQPVHIGGMNASSLPPRLQLQNVTLGSAQEVKVGKIELDFDPISLFSEVKVISNAELEDTSIDGRSLNKLVPSLKLAGSNAQYPVRHLTLQRVKIVTDEVALPSLSGIVEVDAQGAFSRVALHSQDDKLGVDLQAHDGRWQLGVNLKESSLPVLPDVVFSDLSAKGDLSDGEVNFTEMDAHIFNGILLGSAKFNWRKGWQLQGNLQAKTFDLDKMFPKLHLEGEMFGEGTFSMAGAKLSQMDDDPHLDGTFTVKKGTVNVDIVETARLLSRENLVGGRTHFDDMIGQVQLDSHTVHFRQVKIVSGMLSSNGSFDVSPSNQLSGNLNAEIKMRSGNNQLTLYGTLAEQKLRAGR